MRTVIQRVSKASVKVNDKVIGSIGNGLLVLLGVEEADTKEDMQWLSKKISNLRIFEDDNNNMNLSVNDIDGEVLLVSQFSLHASTKKGNRPSFSKAAKADLAEKLYEQMISILSEDLGKELQKGKFGANMQVSLINNGPLTFLLDSKNKE